MKTSDFYQGDILGNIASMFDLAVNNYHIDGDKFWDMFVISGVAEQIEKKNPKYSAGKSGEELILEVLVAVGFKTDKKESSYYFGRSAEFWSGHIIAKSHMLLKESFKEIHSSIKFSELQNMYKTLHEAPDEKTVEIIENRLCNKIVNLKRYRENLDLSQSQLAEQSGVSIRTIQAYEQKEKDINKASVSILAALAEVLKCSINDLLE